MSDHEGFEMLDDTFGVRSESDSSAPNSPQPISLSPGKLQPHQSDAGSPSNHDVLHLGRVGVETGDGTAPKAVGHAPSDRMMAISPQQTGKGSGNVPKIDARSEKHAPWNGVRPNDRITAGREFLAEPSASNDRRSQSPAKTYQSSASVVLSTITADAGREGRVGTSPIEPSSSSKTQGANLSTPNDESEARGRSSIPFVSTMVMEKSTGEPGDLPVRAGAAPHRLLPVVRDGGYERINVDSVVPPTAQATRALFRTFHTIPPGALETSFDPRAAGTAASLPPPVGKQQQQRRSSFGVAGSAGPSIDDLFPTASRGAPSSVATASAEDEAAVVELVGMGFDREHVVRALGECGRGESWKEAAISLLLEPQTSMTPERRLSSDARHEAVGQRLSGHGAGGSSACPICLCDIEAGEVFTVDCRDQHLFCVTCLHRHCSVQLLDAGLIPACPLSSTCSHELSHDEVERVFLLKTYLSGDGNGSSSDSAKGEQDNTRRALDTCGTLLTRRGLESTGAVPCVSPECGNWMVPEGGGQRVKCGACLIEFCGSCKRAPFHYTVACDEVVAIGRAWSTWLTEGKATFLKVMAAQDDEHKALLDQHHWRKRQHDLAVKEAERLRLEYDRMEDWKESRCRCCPECGRVVEKLSGCDIMVCGVDAHGGNVQNGCGVKFSWSRAPPYRGDRGERKITPFTEQQPEAAARSRHFIAEGIALRCDRCHRDVVGPLFRCVHCPSFACCLECQDMACRDPKHAHHIFQLINGSLPLEAASSTAAAPGEVYGNGGGGGDTNGGGDELV